MIRLADLRPLGLFDGLSDEQIGEMLAGGTEVAVEPGRSLFHEGEHADFWWVLVEGALDLIRRIGREDVVVARMDVPGRWAGGFRAWDDDGVYLATARGVRPGRVLRVPAAVLRDRSETWFPFGARLVEGLYHTARAIESTARQRGSLITLGTLAAGLAHEINNPAAAAARAVDDLAAAERTLLSALGRLAREEVTAQQFTALDELRREVGPVAADPDPLARSDREQAVASWLGRRGVAGAWTIAPPLAAAGVGPGWCDRVAAVFPDAGLEPALEWVASTLATESLLMEVRESTRRISELVAAVRSYSQVDRASMQRCDIVEGLDSTLVMLGHRLRGGMTVVRAYAPDLPLVDAYAGELNQVWTNLVDNALDAMDGAGTLTVTTRADGGWVVVDVADTGPGMPSAVSERAFEAFFTTKDVGKGTGLGLDIARRIIVERHGGTIDIDSEPGRTVLRVRLPVRSTI